MDLFNLFEYILFLKVSVFLLQSSMDEEQIQDSDGSPKTLFIFGGGDNEGSFFSDLLTLSVEELED